MLIDVSIPITPGSVFRRGTPPVDIATRRFYDESEGEYQTVMLSLPAHTATHIDLVFPGNSIGLEQMIGPGKLLDATAVRGSSIGLADVEGEVELCEGDFVLFRTDWSRFVGTDRYYRHPELTPEVVQWLISKKVNAVGIDAGGLGVGRTHGEYDRLLVKNGIFVIENLANLAQIPGGRFKVYCFPLKIEGVDAIPARVVVEIEGDG
ncbi:MAG: cyclase family protein [Anaerolineae bacterium]|jgi:kynurenine formamidase